MTRSTMRNLVGLLIVVLASTALPCAAQDTSGVLRDALDNARQTVQEIANRTRGFSGQLDREIDEVANLREALETGADEQEVIQALTELSGRVSRLDTDAQDAAKDLQNVRKRLHEIMVAARKAGERRLAMEAQLTLEHTTTIAVAIDEFREKVKTFKAEVARFLDELRR